MNDKWKIEYYNIVILSRYGRLGKTQKKLLKNPEFKKLYEESRIEFEIAKAIIRARIGRATSEVN